MSAHRVAEVVGVGAVAIATALIGANQLTSARSADAPRVVAEETSIEIKTHVTSVVLDRCVPRNDPFPSVRAPEDVGHPGSDAVITASGLRYRPLSMGCGGPSPTSGDLVSVRLAGWTLDGLEVVGTSGVMSLPMNAVVPGFSEGLQLMHIGDRFRLFVPSHLAYGKGMLTFDVELVAIRGPR